MLLRAGQSRTRVLGRPPENALALWAPRFRLLGLFHASLRAIPAIPLIMNEDRWATRSQIDRREYMHDGAGFEYNSRRSEPFSISAS